ncbi:MAG: TIGR00730 family Rossman fold protein [Halobacteriovorax sp.]|nr:TIGR00730 family Rossman fold protein [Halobacteriovorax sp.]
MNIAVFCGSAKGKTPAYEKMAQDLAGLLKRNNFGLVYGGASVGVMGALANTCLENKVPVIGVIPQSLVDWEVAHKGLDDLIVVDTMHKRKEIMYLRSSAFVVLPGGFGTLDECFEILTWSQLKLHSKPVFILNQNGFYDFLRDHINRAHQEGFISAQHVELLQFRNNLDELENSLKALK